MIRFFTDFLKKKNLRRHVTNVYKIFYSSFLEVIEKDLILGTLNVIFEKLLCTFLPAFSILM